MRKDVAIFLIFCLSLMVPLLRAQGQTGAPLRLLQTIPLPNVEGGMDHMAVDLKGQRLFIPAEPQKSIEVVDLRAGKVIHTIKGFGGFPRKVIYLPQSNEIWVDDGDGTCKAFNGDSYELVATIPLSDVKGTKLLPDNGAYDPVTGYFYVAVTGSVTAKDGTIGSIAIVDTKMRKYIGDIKMGAADPAGIVLDPSGPMMFVIVGDTSQVAVIDRDKRTLVSTWPLTGGPYPHAVALDATHHRLFVGSRVKPGHLYQPGKMLVLDSDTGKVIQGLDIVGGVDEIFYDRLSQRIYVSGAMASIDVFKQIDPDHYELLGKVPTGFSGRTSLLAPELQRLYSAVPKHIIYAPPVPESKEAFVEEGKILVFAVLP